MPSLYDMLAGVLGSRAPGEDPYGFLAGALKADPEGAGGFADIAGRSREASAAAGAITAPLGALDYFGKTLRGEAPLYDPRTGHPSDEAYGAAGTLAGVGMTGGIGGTGPGGVALGAGPIRAYHGSPHDFERFDLSKLGTGQGAQAQGHGLYFAENEGIGQAYRDALASGTPGHMYEVNIHADPEKFLAWDKPLAEQPAAVQKLAAEPGTFPPHWAELDKLYGPGELPPRLGRDVVEGLQHRMTPDEVSKTLKEAGIPGVRYLDAASRDTGSGTQNFAVFDPATIEILRKYGFLGPLFAGAATASMPEAARK